MSAAEPRGPGSLHLTLLALLFVAAAGLRGVSLSNPSFWFHPTRQYHSALLARAYYYAIDTSVASERRQVAEKLRLNTGTLEPPITEAVVALGYRIVGHETVIVPRVVTSLFWLLGGVFLYGLARRLLSADAALYHISTHDYYQLPLLPIVALSLGVLADSAFSAQRARDARTVRLVAALLVALATYVSFDPPTNKVRFGALTVLRSENDSGISLYRKIGELVHHSSKTIFLSADSYGEPLRFYGELTGVYWKTRRDEFNAKRRGQVTPDHAKRFAELLQDGAEFFISTTPHEFYMQTDLRQMLDGHFPILAQAPDFKIYDLRRPVPAPR